MAEDQPRMIVFYDGLCGFCDRTVSYILQRDRDDRFRFAPLQRDLAEEILPKHGKNPKDLDTLYLLVDQGLPTERVLDKSSAAVHIGKTLGGFSRFGMTLVGILPKPIRDWGYDRVAKARYKLFGKMSACRIPSAQDRAKFLGL